MKGSTPTILLQRNLTDTIQVRIFEIKKMKILCCLLGSIIYSIFISKLFYAALNWVFGQFLFVTSWGFVIQAIISLIVIALLKRFLVILCMPAIALTSIIPVAKYIAIIPNTVIGIQYVINVWAERIDWGMQEYIAAVVATFFGFIAWMFIIAMWWNVKEEPYKF